MSMSASYKPSPLSFGSPRASPFRRPESQSPAAASPSPLRQSTPNPTLVAAKNMLTPSRFGNSGTSNSTTETTTSKWTPRGVPPAFREFEPSPTKGANMSPGFGGPLKAANSNYSNDDNAISKLSQAQVREMREGFQILDRDSDGQVGREDVADMLTQLGLSSNASELAGYFPPSTPQTVTLPTFLNSLATLLCTLSPTPELLDAFSAFDEDDSGQVDYAELRDALINTAPDPGVKPLTEREVDRVMGGFTARKALSKHTGAMGGARRQDVFKYQEFIANVAGGSGADGRGEKVSDDGDE
ncbi:hypothetical protein SS1G_07304 [Sclerotinia sclerotiorum 1980 UF-70]|uniref:EF-hand domain-containing protein n=2 Tax=Sclerotinia sclerotiorum (strain ATCC 18683 / 1980 / Ss-1) TaxID=665079 RepID=A7EPQ5_SCLS1|nr:hypothetical protein SS1G_07304 [Sclerotinia sclerotiorum 1980 UF-70]APA10253.1 hypothetical protein sscle_06g050230 [Sclerotinia sclerotiorum 1980 UF-70]EDO04821.1 hypothetical protein SS1G_07304 [Sclerotinia sclerotiorum 1980 UF-70]